MNALKEMNLKLFDEGHRVASYNHEHTSENDIVTTNRIIWLQFFNSKQSVSEEKVNGQLSLDAWFEETEKRYTS
ncbi:hypothetical protein [Legionella busanensis]|uniref:hypothetical protein n=1 Tax=Legionella busanensis TaxID=190655 RepID=UPI001040E321|nr:hypothetical protein [Legionella busanensis]